MPLRIPPLPTAASACLRLAALLVSAFLAAAATAAEPAPAPATGSAPLAPKANEKTPQAKVKLIFDTDMRTDCDDAGAMAVLHALADRGECEILATVASVPDLDSIATVDAINRWYGRPDLPLGVVKEGGVRQKSRFTGRIAKEFPHRVRSLETIPDSADVYRKVLEAQPDRSVVVCTVGYLTNLKNLLRQPAAEGRKSGPDLVRAKVARWICMGGNFIGSPPKDDLKLGNVNFQRDAKSAFEVVRDWPGEIVFVGREVASVPSGVEVGASLEKTPAENPVRGSYFHYFGGFKNRHVADLATVLFAVRGPAELWNVESKGSIDLRPDMTFSWRPEVQPPHDRKESYLLKKRGADGRPNDREVEAALDVLLVQPPRAASDAK